MDPDGLSFVKTIAVAGASYFVVRWVVLFCAFLFTVAGS
jgi:hypothetical protein